MSPPQYKLPNLLAFWPWNRQLSTHYSSVKSESSAWLESFHPFSAKEQASFNACDFALLACLTYPSRTQDFTRVACDLMNFYFVYDEYTDLATPEEAKAIGDSVVDVFHHRDTELGTTPTLIVSIAKEFWARAETLVRPGSPCLEHFLSGFEEYLAAVAQEAKDRSEGRVRSVQDYLLLRRGTSSSKAIFSLIEFGLDLPSHVLDDPIIQRMADITADICAITNDMHSYRLEHARGLDSHNILTAIMHEHGIGLQGALGWLGAYVGRLMTEFLTYAEQPSHWDKATDAKVKIYIDGLGSWVRGNECWCYETKRYYGDGGETVRKTGLISLKERESGFLKKDEFYALVSRL